MSLLKIILIIVVLWFIIRIKRLISRIKISSGNIAKHQNKKNSKVSMDIQDADYEDVE